MIIAPPVAPDPIDELPAGPDPAADPPSVFSSKAAASVLAQRNMVPQVNQGLEYINEATASVAHNAQEAFDSAGIAVAAAAAAASTVNAVAWVSGKSYEQNESAISQIDFQTYRRKVAGAGTTDPSQDPDNWVALGDSKDTGDIVLTARTMTAPSWLPCDGTVYAAGTYPRLDAVLGPGGIAALEKQANPATLPNDSGKGVAFSPDKQYLAVATNSTPYINVYKRDGDTFTKLPDPVAVAGVAEKIDFSSDGTYLAVAHATSPFITVYKITGDTFTKITLPVALAGAGKDVAFSPDSIYLAASHATTPFITIYKRTAGTDTFTKLTDPATLPGSQGNGVVFSADGAYLAIALQSTPYFAVYSRSGDTFTKLTDPGVLPPGIGYNVDFSPDGVYLALGCNGGGPTIYKRSGLTLTKLGGVDYPTVDVIRGVSFSPDGAYLAIGASGGTINIFRRDGDQFTKLPDPAVLPAGTVYDVAFSKDGIHLAAVHTGLPYVTIYKASTGTLAPSLPAPFGLTYYIKTGA